MFSEMELDKIYCGNCVDIMQQIDDGTINLTLTSPPYDNLRSYNGYSFPLTEIIDNLYRITIDGGIVVWVVGDATINGSETGTSFKTALAFMDRGFNLHDTMIFKKKNPIPQIYRKRYRNDFEYMFVFSKGPVKTHNALREECKHSGLILNGTTYKNYSRGVQRREKLAAPVKKDKIRGNIWEYVVGKRAEDQEAKGHPAPFPCQLARDHIVSWTNPEDVVLDPMCGSGTTCVCAKELGRHFIGIDVSEEYCQMTRDRLVLHSPSNLFD